MCSLQIERHNEPVAGNIPIEGVLVEYHRQPGVYCVYWYHDDNSNNVFLEVDAVKSGIKGRRGPLVRTCRVG